MSILFQRTFEGRRFVARLSLATELWWSTLESGDRKYSILHIGYTVRGDDRLWVLLLLGLSFRIGFVQAASMQDYGGGIGGA